MPLALHQEEIEQLDQIINRGHPLRKGEVLFRQNEPFKSLYALRAGSIKTSLLSSTGSEQVTGFYFPGELIGFDGIGAKQHTCSAVALEATALCEIPFEQLAELSQQLPTLQQHTLELLSNEIVDDRKLLALLGKGNAESRLAMFLLSLSARQQRRQLPVEELCLSMRRADIGNYLGLTVETISRVLHKFQLDGLIAVQNRNITITDLPALRQFNTLET